MYYPWLTIEAFGSTTTPYSPGQQLLSFPLYYTRKRKLFSHRASLEFTVQSP